MNKNKIVTTILLGAMSVAAVVLFFLVPKHIPYEYDLAVLSFCGAALFFGIALAAKFLNQEIIKTACLSAGVGFILFYSYMSSKYGSFVLFVWLFFPSVIGLRHVLKRRKRAMFDHLREKV